MKSTFKVLFYIKRSAQKKNGTMPIVDRITVNGKISQFNTKRYACKKSNIVKINRNSGYSYLIFCQVLPSISHMK